VSGCHLRAEGEHCAKGDDDLDSAQDQRGTALDVERQQPESVGYCAKPVHTRLAHIAPKSCEFRARGVGFSPLAAQPLDLCQSRVDWFGGPGPDGGAPAARLRRGLLDGPSRGRRPGVSVVGRLGERVSAYHAGLQPETRAAGQSAFLRGELRPRRLDAMERCVRAVDCRQAQMLGYFGGAAEAWRCRPPGRTAAPGATHSIGGVTGAARVQSWS
jgi:hypothetical protein